MGFGRNPMLAESTQQCYSRNTTEMKPVRWLVEVADVEKDRRENTRATEKDSGETHRASLSENRNKSIRLPAYTRIIEDL